MLSAKARPVRSTIVSAILSAALSACGGNSSEGDPSSTTSGLSITSVEVSGSVGDGPITGAELNFYDANGVLVSTTSSDNLANYTVHFSSGVAFPVTVVARNGIDVVTGEAPTFDLASVIESAGHNVVNVNPFSTLIAKMAAKMPGGITGANLQLAKEMIRDNFSFGLAQTLMPDPINSSVTATNAAAIVKSSEVLAELIRRVHAALEPMGQSYSEAEVIDMLASDMTDGFLDGEGTPGAKPLAAAVAKVLEAQVLYEALTNDLTVNGIRATSAMDDALRVILPGTILSTTDVDISDSMLEQTDAALAAVSAVVTSTDIDAVRQIIATARESDSLDNLVLGVKPVSVVQTSSYDLSAEINTALNTVTTDSSTVTTVNNTELGNKRNALPKVVLSSAEATITSGGTTMLEWSASNSVACGASGGWSGAKPVSGKEVSPALMASTKFALKCYGNNGKSATAALTVYVQGSANVIDTTGSGATPSEPTIIEPAPAPAPEPTPAPTPEPTPAPTPEPTPAPTPEPTPAPTPEPTPAPEPVDNTAPEALVIRVNAGGADYVDRAGNLWKADYGFNTGAAFSITDAISGTTDDALYQSERWDDAAGNELEYAFAVPNGRYVVNLHFAERFQGTGSRVFDVQFENRTLLDNVDIFAQAGHLTALIKGVAVDVTDGQINIRFVHSVENPKIDAIEIIQVDTTVPVTQPPLVATTAPVKLTWTANPSSDNVVGYLVYYGGDENSVSIPAGDIRTDSVGFSPAAPSLTYQPETDLGLQAGNRVCFKIRAYNADGLSAWSAPVCGVIAQAI